MNWVNKHKMLVIKAIKYNNQPCLNIDDLWQALHLSFNTALHHSVDASVLDKIASFSSSPWASFFKEEFRNTITNCNNLSTLSSDKLLWSYLKHILQDINCLNSIIKIANMYIDLEYWPSHFKKSTTVIIPKPKKSSYNSSKSFRPIVLLNTVGKLIEKVIGERLQFHIALNNFIYPSQLGSWNSSPLWM